MRGIQMGLGWDGSVDWEWARFLLMMVCLRGVILRLGKGVVGWVFRVFCRAEREGEGVTDMNGMMRGCVRKLERGGG